MKPYIRQCYYCWRRSRRESNFKIMRKKLHWTMDVQHLITGHI
nr:MAG TPA: hypothetical protein [Microviridae sp.]